MHSPKVKSSDTLFQSILGDRIDLLAGEVRESHHVRGIKVLSGSASITRGKTVVAKVVSALFRFPHSGVDVPVTVTKYPTEHGETWVRDFDGAQFRSYLSKISNSDPLPRVFEKFGLMKFELSLPVVNGELHWHVKRGWFLGLRIPSVLLPTSNTREFEQAGKMHFDVELVAPMGFGLLVNYKGWLQPQPSATKVL